MPGRYSRRHPWPWDLTLDGFGLMLRPDEQGQLVGRRAQPIEATPTEYAYGSTSPLLERTYPLRNLTYGMGQRIQEDGDPHRYYYAINLDPSINGRWIKGPLFNAQTVDRDGRAIGPMAVAPYSGTDTLFVAAGERLYRRVSDGADFGSGTSTGSNTGTTLNHTGAGWIVNRWAGYAVSITAGTGAGQSRTVSSNTATALTVSSAWTVTPDATSQYQIGPFALVSIATGTINQLARFKFKGASARDALIWTTSSGRVYDLDTSGTTVYTYNPASEGPPISAQYIVVLVDELWVGGNGQLQKCEADPRTRANWAGVITVDGVNVVAAGEASAPITWLQVIHNELFIFKTDGIYTIGTDGFSQALYTGIGVTPSSSNGKNAASWLDALWVPMRDGFVKITPDGTLDPIGTEQLLDNGSEVQGQIVAFAGHNTWFGYVVLYNARNSNSYLLKYGSWIEDENANGKGVLHQASVYHGALKRWSGKQATTTTIAPMTGANDRQYVGFANGTVEYQVLPQNGPNPIADANCRFTLDDGEMYWPVHHANFQADNKAYRGFSVFGPSGGMDVSNWAEIYYRLDPSAPWTPVTRVSTDLIATPFTRIGQRIDLQADANVAGRQIEIKTLLKNATTSTTPILDGCAVHEQIRPAFVLLWTFSALAHNYVVRRDGLASPRRSDAIRQRLLDAAAQVGAVRLVLPDESIQYATVVDYKEDPLPPGKRHGMEWDVALTAIQYKSLSSAGSSSSGDPVPYANLRGLTYASLAGYTYGQLETLLL